MTGIPSEVYDRIGGGSGDPAESAASPGGPQASGSTTLANPAPWFVEWLTGQRPGEPGPVVNEWTALNYAALYACVSLIANTVASLPLKVYRRRKNGEGQDEAPDRPEYDRFQVEFNPNTSAMTGREAGVGHLLTWGNSYCQIVRNKFGEVLRLQPLGPDIVCAETNDRGELQYEVTNRKTGQVEHTLPRDQVLHVPGLSFDAMCGYSTVRVARHAIRTGMAQDREAEKFVTRGIRPPGAIKMPAGKKFANDAAALKFRDTFRRLHNTEDGSLNIIILEDGYEWEQLGVDPESAQLLESRQFSAIEICGIYHVPPHLVALVEKTSSWGTGVEEMTIGFVVYCILPILRRIEQEINRKLFRDPGSRDYFAEHVLSGLLRGDSFKQSQAIKIYVNLGVLTINEARRLLGWNPVKGGNVRYFPLNMGRVDAETGEDIPPPPAAELPAVQSGGEPPTPAPSNPSNPSNPPPADDAEARARLAASLRTAIVSASGRCLRKEAAEATRAARKSDGFVAWVHSFYPKHREMIEESLGPLLDAWAAAFGNITTADGSIYPPWSWVGKHVSRSEQDLMAAAECKPNELAAAVERTVERWQSDRLAELAAEFQPGGVPNAV